MSPPVAAALNAGLRAHRSGQLPQAIAAYDAVLIAAPDHPTAIHLRGFAKLQLDQPESALGDLTDAIRLEPANANAWGHLAICRDRLAQVEAAGGAARRSVALAPAGSEALDVLARGPHGSERVTAWLLAVAPGDPVAWAGAGQRAAEQHRDRAIAHLRRAQCLAPHDASTRLDLVDLIRRDKAPERALRLAEQCLAMRPNDPRALSEHAAAAIELGAADAARVDTCLALVIAPDTASAWGNRAEAHYLVGEFAAAASAGGRAHAASPKDPEISANLGAYRLAIGDLRNGWRLFRDRPARRGAHIPGLPRWNGEPGARLVVLAEQGLGDELLFSTLWRDLQDQVLDGKIAGATVETDARLIPLGARALPQLEWRPRFRQDGVGTDATHWCLTGDLAEVFRPTIDRFPGPGPGVEADPDKVGRWRHWLHSVGGGRQAIGFCWRSGSATGARRRHYPSFAECAPVLARQDTFFVVLQYDDCGQEVTGATLGAGSDLVIPPDLDRRDDQDGVAALMRALDLVVSADTAVLALAGALGLPAVGFALHPSWVGLGQSRHPWFPQVERIYRKAGSDWRGTMARVAARVGGA